MKKVLISGAFDLLHSGHIMTLILSKKFGDKLIVNVLPDNRIKEKKGDDRPISSQNERIFIVGSLNCVDEAVCVKHIDGQSKEKYMQQVIKTLNPDVVVMSEQNDNIKKYCDKKYVKFIHLPSITGIDGLHTTDIINKIRRG